MKRRKSRDTTDALVRLQDKRDSIRKVARGFVLSKIELLSLALKRSSKDPQKIPSTIACDTKKSNSSDIGGT